MDSTGVLMRRLAALAVVSLLAGCTVGPEYEEPDIDWRAEWETDLYEDISVVEDSEELDLAFWWYLFDDPVLNELIEIAKRESPSLRIAGLRVIEAQAALGIAGGYRYPQVQQLTGDAAYLGTVPDGGDYQDDTTWDLGGNVGWEIDFWGRFRRGVEAADAAFFASIANQQDFQVLLAAQVADLYFAYRSILLRVDIARNSAASLPGRFRRFPDGGQFCSDGFLKGLAGGTSLPCDELHRRDEATHQVLDHVADLGGCFATHVYVDAQRRRPSRIRHLPVRFVEKIQCERMAVPSGRNFETGSFQCLAVVIRGGQSVGVGGAGPGYGIGQRTIRGTCDVVDAEPTAGLEDSGDLSAEPFLVGDVHADVEHDGGVERRIREGHVEGVTLVQFDPVRHPDPVAKNPAGLYELRRQIDPGYPTPIPVGHEAPRPAQATSHIQGVVGGREPQLVDKLL